MYIFLIHGETQQQKPKQLTGVIELGRKKGYFILNDL